MGRKIVAGCLSLAMVFSFIVMIVHISPVVKAPMTWYVDDEAGGTPAENFTSIQDAISACGDGDTIFVYNGTYSENVVVDKTINLTGEDWNNTIIDGGGSDDVVTVTANWVNITGFKITGSGQTVFNAGVELYKVENCAIERNNISNNTWGIYFERSDRNEIRYNDCVMNEQAIYAGYSYHNKIENNNLTFNDYNGIFLYYSDNNMIANNNATNNSKPTMQGGGICISFSNYNIIEGNNFSDTPNDQSSGIHIDASSRNNLMLNNSLRNNKYGIDFFGSGGYNKIVGNNISNNEFGVHIISSSDNLFYHNNFINNTIQVKDDSSPNSWNETYPIGGNYWSNYVGFDFFKGPDQNIPGSDGIGDHNYTIDTDSFDNYPLMEPYTGKALENYTILKQGWNLISIPLIQEEQNLTRVLGSIDGWYDSVQWFDITNTKGPWKHLKVDKPFGDSLYKINETMGFWIHITNPGDSIFLYNGLQPTSNQTIQLHPGWNMVGYSSLTNYNRTDGLNNLTFDTHVDAIWTYNSATQKYKELTASDYFEIGKGYYIHAKEECTWVVPL